MASSLDVGDRVQTPFGKGVVREVRNGGRLLVDLQGRAIVLAASDLRKLGEATRPTSARTPERASQRLRPAGDAPADVDLHGLTVDEALARVDQALNDALLAGLPDLRFIHGRSGGRLRGALHRRLREIQSVRGFEVDPRNAGVTVVRL